MSPESKYNELGKAQLVRVLQQLQCSEYSPTRRQQILVIESQIKGFQHGLRLGDVLL